MGCFNFRLGTYNVPSGPSAPSLTTRPKAEFGLDKVYWTFNLLAVFCLFEALKMFYPPEELCRAEHEGGQIVCTDVFFGLGNVYWTFNLLAVFCLFQTLKMFYPPEGLCRAEPVGGPIVFT